jgi:hypothetical protein
LRAARASARMPAMRGTGALEIDAEVLARKRLDRA